ncbi:MAG: hypothetical protein AAB404_02935 [Patescibacteria group bacterium]
MLSSFKNFIYENKGNILIILSLVLMISLSFGLGYLLARETNQAPIIIEKCSSD